MRLTLALIFGLAVPAAAGLDASAPGYWTQQYNIPEYYETAAVSIANKNPAADQKRWAQRLVALGARPLDVRLYRAEGAVYGYWPAAGQTVWEVPTSSLPRVLAELRRKETFDFYDVHDAAPAPLVELSDKREGLLREAEAHPEIAASDPVRSFVEQELTTLGQLAWLDRAAREKSALALTFASEDRRPPFLDFPPGRLKPLQTIFAPNDPAAVPFAPVRLSTQTSSYPSSFWQRTSQPPGTARPKSRLMLQVEDADAVRAKVEKIGEKFGTLVDGPDIQAAMISPEFRVSGKHIFIRVNSRRVNRLREKIAGLGNMIYWSAAESGAQAYEKDAVKRDLLVAERRRLSSVLGQAPMTRALLDSEIARLDPIADAYMEQSKQNDVEVILGNWIWQ